MNSPLSDKPSKAELEAREACDDTTELVELDTGAHRSVKAGKGRYDLISPHMMRRLALIHEEGAQELQLEDVRDWEKGIPLSDLLSTAVRHTFQRLRGMTDEDHLGKAVWNLAAAIHMEEEVKAGRLPENLLDIPCST